MFHEWKKGKNHQHISTFTVLQAPTHAYIPTSQPTRASKATFPPDVNLTLPLFVVHKRLCLRVRLSDLLCPVDHDGHIIANVSHQVKHNSSYHKHAIHCYNSLKSLYFDEGLKKWIRMNRELWKWKGRWYQQMIIMTSALIVCCPRDMKQTLVCLRCHFCRHVV